MEKRSKIYTLILKEALKRINESYPKLKVLNVSVFGSALHSKNPADFDFLFIVEGNTFIYNEAEVEINQNGQSKRYLVGMSIKGLDNFAYEVLDETSNFPLEEQKPIIYRTAVSLFRRHVPILGYDFVDNKEIFLENVFAQASDLLCNAYERFYVNEKKFDISPERRSAKILLRMYEAISYLGFLDPQEEINNLRKSIYFSITKSLPLLGSKELFDETKRIYLNCLSKLKTD